MAKRRIRADEETRAAFADHEESEPSDETFEAGDEESEPNDETFEASDEESEASDEESEASDEELAQSSRFPRKRQRRRQVPSLS